MTIRRLRVLIQGLPAESATMTALRNAMSDEELAATAEAAVPEEGRWSQEEQLLAAVHDALRRIEYVLICSNSEKKDHPKPPEPMRRPGARPVKTGRSLTDEGAEHLFRLINSSA
ncbi:hypothetical protein [Streptomyces sp. NPDC047315]|uniref:hypothetical protein n=1 Tax=Streptomyces sp. NPDC047315 TaxID=3155142 RepID=UPI0033FEFADF